MKTSRTVHVRIGALSAILLAASVSSAGDAARAASYRNNTWGVLYRNTSEPLGMKPKGTNAVPAVKRDLSPEARALPPLVFFTGAPVKSGSIPNAIGYSGPLDGKWGCSIRVIDPAHPEIPARAVFAENDSFIYDLALSFDARTVWFSMKRHRSNRYQIFRMDLAAGASSLVRLTDGGSHNVSPAPLPDGRLAFISSRTPGSHTVCQSGPSTHVYVMDGDGTHVERLSSNTLSDFYLSVLSDGRLLFTRWEYVDVNLTYRQSLWTQYPDGRQFALWYGNLLLDPASLGQAMEIPGTDVAVCTLMPHHGSPYGALGIVSPRVGPEGDGPDSLRNLTPEYPSIVDRNLFWAYCWPCPVARDRFLCSWGAQDRRFRLCLIDADGNRAVVYDDPATSCFRALPLVPRTPPKTIPVIRPAVTNFHVLAACPPGQPQAEKVPLGTLVVSDVHKGLVEKIPHGTVTHVRIMEQLPKTMNRTWNGVLDQGPLLGASSYYAKRVWGYAPVAADGSACFEAPALKEIYLQLVDADGREIQRMTSAINLMPGETQSCVGCHENRRTSALPLPTSAARRAPTPITPPSWGNAGVLDYNIVVQPVWNRCCIRCHSGANPPKGLSLVGDRTRFFSMSYDGLVLRSGSDRRSRAYYKGDSKEKPLVQSLHLLCGVMEPFRPRESGSFASRLPDYLAKEHCGTEVSADDRRRVYEWIDAMIPYYPTSDYAHLRGKSNRDRWGDRDSAELLPWFTKRFLPVYTNRCASCHGSINLKQGLSNSIEPQWWWIDLTKPELSPALVAHLPVAAGGRGQTANGRFAFASKEDPLYLQFLDIFREAAREAAKTPEADEPGFVSRARGFGEYR